jgi:TolB protein
MARSYSFSALVAALALASTALAESRPPILVTDPSARTYRAAIQEFVELGPQREAGRPVRLRRSLGDALAFSGLFASVETQAFLGPKVTPSLDDSLPVCPNWRQIGADALLQGEVRATGEELSVEFRLLDVARGCVELLQKRYKGARGDEARIAHVIADDVVAAFTGTRGVADTEIAFVSNRSGAKEIYVMGAEGENVRRATRNRSINNFPDWAPDGRNIVYTSYREGARPWLYMLARGGKSPGRILRGLAGNAQLYRGVFDPKGKRLAVVVSQDGASELYVVGRDGGNPQRVTHHRAIDIAPTWSPDGRRLAFVSDRTGSPQVYLMDADGGTVRRLTGHPMGAGSPTRPAWVGSSTSGSSIPRGPSTSRSSRTRAATRAPAGRRTAASWSLPPRDAGVRTSTPWISRVRIFGGSPRGRATTPAPPGGPTVAEGAGGEARRRRGGCSHGV